MNEQLADTKLRQFLLGDVDELEREQIEKRFISDPQSKQRILIAEEDLIEDYLEDSLSPIQKQQFLAQYGYTPQHRRRLQITRLIKENAMSGAPSVDAAPMRRSSFFSQLWSQNMRILIPALAVLIIAVIAGVIWISQSSRRTSEEANQRTMIERELAELNSTTTSPLQPSEVVSVVLPPISVREAGSNHEVMQNPGTRVIELHLLWTQKQEFSSYQITLNRVAVTEQFTISGLHAQDDKFGRVVIVKIPTHLLRRGLYQINLSGAGASSPSSLSEEYTFTVD
jgi:hypothetical protein